MGTLDRSIIKESKDTLIKEDKQEMTIKEAEANADLPKAQAKREGLSLQELFAVLGMNMHKVGKGSKHFDDLTINQHKLKKRKRQIQKQSRRKNRR